ncbi:MAG: oligosaccharide flippase family protein [Flavobacteriales bacterium]|nr:oligosaccharide flippase family protein [Flavobacteriales bacterium]
MKSKKQNKALSKFNVDLLWNMASFGLMGLIGLSFNVIILKFYDEEVLGVFNLTYAIYIVLSQLAVGGFHLAVQYYVPYYRGQAEQQTRVLNSSILLSSISSFIIIALVYFFQDVSSLIFKSENLPKAIIWTFWGLIFFSLNKVIISFYNGKRFMKLFAVLQALRFIFILASLLIMIALKVDPYILASSLALSELLLFVICFISLFITEKISFLFSFNNASLKENYQFGMRALLGNLLLDVNTKVDVIVLGLFVSDAKIGIYSFAASFFEGLMQIATLLRNNINPILAQLKQKNNKPLTQKIIGQYVKSFYKIIAPVSLVSVLGFYLVLNIFEINEFRTEYLLVFGILNLGLMVSGGYQPFLMVFNQFGLPNTQTKFVALVFVSNVIFNFIFVPTIGITGAALGTAISFVLLAVYCRVFIRKSNIL